MKACSKFVLSMMFELVKKCLGWTCSRCEKVVAFCTQSLLLAGPAGICKM